MKRWMLALLAALPVAAAAGTLTVVERIAKIRKKPSSYSASVGEVRAGEKVASTEESEGWYHVTTSAGSGWIHSKSVTTKSVARLSGSGDGSASSAEDTALAAKGFNPEVEKAYKKKNPSLDFAAVDDLERTKVSEDEILRFAAEGGLGGER